MPEDTTTKLPAIPAPPKAEELAKEVAPVVAAAKELKVDSDMMYGEAGEELRNIKSKFKVLEERRKAITGPLDLAKKSVMDLFRAPLESLTEAENIIKKSMLTYSQEQERIRDEENRKQREAHEREQERLRREAEEARQSGDEATASVLEHTSDVMTAAEPVARPAPRAQGIGTVTRWSAEVSDKRAFIEFCLTDAGAQYFDALQVDMKPLNQLAVALKDNLNIPGVKAVPTAGISARC
ncbi:MAG: hypothetical protein ACJ75S_07290 [Solirubrobacterales bacterium]